jgi:hypothetical protein
VISSQPILLAAFLSIVATTSPSPPTGSECAPDLDIQVTYRPPIDSILAVTDTLQPSKDRLFTGKVTPPAEYRTYANALIEVDSNGIPLSVRFPVGDGVHASSGNRAVDKAIIAWGMQMRFTPDSCSQLRVRFASMPIKLG